MKEEGLDNIIERHRNYRDMVRSSVQAMGLELLAKDEYASHALTAVVAPEQIGANQIRKFMLEQFNIVLAGGQQKLDNVIFRIGHLGYVRELDLLAALAALEISLYKLGWEIELGIGINKAQTFILNKTQKGD
jgi:aspartate aminotransferase-like enzyme